MPGPVAGDSNQNSQLRDKDLGSGTAGALRNVKSCCVRRELIVNSSES